MVLAIPHRILSCLTTAPKGINRRKNLFSYLTREQQWHGYVPKALLLHGELQYDYDDNEPGRPGQIESDPVQIATRTRASANFFRAPIPDLIYNAYIVFLFKEHI